jgi:hypothetical protein
MAPFAESARNKQQITRAPVEACGLVDSNPMVLLDESRPVGLASRSLLENSAANQQQGFRCQLVQPCGAARQIAVFAIACLTSRTSAAKRPAVCRRRALSCTITAIPSSLSLAMNPPILPATPSRGSGVRSWTEGDATGRGIGALPDPFTRRLPQTRARR